MSTKVPMYSQARVKTRTWSRDELKWEPENGEPMFIKDIPHDHFVNILNWIWDNFECYENSSPGLYAFMEGEARFRTLLALASGDAHPHKIGERYHLRN